ncbi:hypothetical protein [Nocardia sp. CNY236]|uniref:hypothetical protein n=1 Tax=Nocardia sp. CNY236 TaxID=1169152 RepID=UPI0012DD71E0|nr:hypothetical protein [Nocardia sp. CNY236]
MTMPRLRVLIDNRPALHLYRACGFAFSGLHLERALSSGCRVMVHEMELPRAEVI